ncbi:MAG: glycine zipper 2TM domain-containing protein [Thermodesulfobacteriota bacterium]|nr:glycine zipper 2TM domain-containing protein [Thermodesulfobacteriota bacterium]
MKFCRSVNHLSFFIIASFFLFVSCANAPNARYNTQKYAAIGSGAGALIGQAIGGNTESTLIGLAAGTIIGAFVGNAIDQDYQAARDAALHGKQVIYYDKNGHAVEAIPEVANEPNCRKVRKRIWENGKLIKETVEEICDPPVPVVRYYPAPLPPPAYYYGWWGLPVVPSFSFYFGRPHYWGHKRYHPHRHRYYHGRHHCK